MSASLRSDATSCALQVNGADKLLINENGSMTVPMVTGMFRKLKCSANGTSGAVLVSADEIVLSTAAGGSYKILAGVNLTGLAVTNTGANGLDTGLLAANTWYSVWVIWNGTTVAGLLSLSETSPTMPSGYTHKARVGWVRTDGTGNKYPLNFTQFGRSVQYRIAAGSNITSLPLIASGSTGGSASSIAVGNFAPMTASSVLVILGLSGGVTGNLNLAVGPNASVASAGVEYSGGYINTGSGTYAHSIQCRLQLESTSIYYSSQAAVGRVAIFGWEDNL